MPIGDREIEEGKNLAFPVFAANPAADELTYSATGLPEGATFDSHGFSWTPGYDQAGDHEITFSVTDGTTDNSETITVSVSNTNRGPSIVPVEDKSVAEQENLTFSISASDPDDDALTYSAADLPSGAKFDTDTGAFDWTPGYEFLSGHLKGNGRRPLCILGAGNPGLEHQPRPGARSHWRQECQEGPTAFFHRFSLRSRRGRGFALRRGSSKWCGI